MLVQFHCKKNVQDKLYITKLNIGITGFNHTIRLISLVQF